MDSQDIDVWARLDELHVVLDKIGALHQPVNDGKFSLINWTYCSCGATAPHMMEDNHISEAPINYHRCPVVQLLDTIVHD
jgi:hypothetical protein